VIEEESRRKCGYHKSIIYLGNVSPRHLEIHPIHHFTVFSIRKSELSDRYIHSLSSIGMATEKFNIQFLNFTLVSRL